MFNTDIYMNSTGHHLGNSLAATDREASQTSGGGWTKFFDHHPKRKLLVCRYRRSDDNGDPCTVQYHVPATSFSAPCSKDSNHLPCNLHLPTTSDFVIDGTTKHMRPSQFHAKFLVILMTLRSTKYINISIAPNYG